MSGVTNSSDKAALLSWAIASLVNNKNEWMGKF